VGIRLKLALALLVIVGGSLASAYVIVVPQLENRLVAAKLSSMERDAVGVAVSLPVDQFSWDLYAENASVATSARVVVFSVLSRTPITLASLGDSRADASTDVEDDPVALRSAETNSVTRGRVTRGGREYAEVAAPALSGEIVLLSSSLADQLATVELVQRRLFEAALVALGLAATTGTLAAGMHARRIRRLERAANRIAAGEFGEPVVDQSSDELGQLASAFERMRVQLAQLDSARREFVANASHELRTPLFSLSGFLELLADEELDEPTRARFLATMREQVDRLTKLATDLLDLSRMDAGSLRVEHEDTDLGEAARTLADELLGLAEARGQRLEVEAESDVWALADEERVLQIGRALGGNALVHTPAGTRVTLRARRDGLRSALEVVDDGPGIAAEHLDRIFERFYRIEGGQASGSGLGLTIARELAERMDGTLEVRSRPGENVFVLRLPLAATPARAPEVVAG
jgi:signal transduction histidine kinase